MDPHQYFPLRQPLLGGRHVAAAILLAPLGATGITIILSTFVLGLSFVLRRDGR